MRRRTKMKDSISDLSIGMDYYLTTLSEIAVSSFEWENMPDTINTRWIEEQLFYLGKILFLKDDVAGYQAVRMSGQAGFDNYNEPIKRVGYTSNGANWYVDNKNSVIMYNTLLKSESYTTLRMFAKKLAELDNIITVNVNAQKTPVLVLAPDNQRLTMKNLYMMYEGNEPFIYGDKSLDVSGFQVLKTDAPYVADKIYELKERYWNEALSYLGISNVAEQKRERMVTDEVMKSQGVTQANRNSRLEARQNACDEINRMFGLNISVKFRAEETQNPDLKPDVKEGVE